MLIEKGTEWEEKTTGEILLFGVIGKLFYALPDREWLQSLFEQGVFDEAPYAGDQPDVIEGLRLIRGWGEQWPVGIDSQAIEALNVDQTRMFVGIGRVLVPQWESVFYTEERLVFQEGTLDVRRWYKRFGLQVENFHREPDDHISLEIAFSNHLTAMAMQGALHAPDESQAYLEAKSQFLQEHLLKWGPYWCCQVIDQAKTDFYRGAALVLRGAFRELASELNLPFSLELVL
jgi:putative dimethyl sulfoxide reductase chaperone